MTLHWWMHWFWVTLWFTVVTGIPLPSKIVSITTQTTIEGEKKSDYATTTLKSFSTETDEIFSVSHGNSSSYFSSLTLRQNLRVPKAIGIIPPIATTLGIEKLKDDGESPSNITILRNDDAGRVDRDAKMDKKSVLKLEDGISTPVGDDGNYHSSNNHTNENLNINNKNNSNNRSLNLATNRSLSLIKKDSKVTWILTANKTSRNEKLINDGYRRNSSFDNDDDNDENLAVLPLQEPIPTRFKLVLNRTKFIPSTNLNDDDNDNDKLLSKSEDVEIRDDVVETRILATAASILQGVSESPRLSRARSAFPGDYQQDEQQEQRQDKPSENSFGNATSSAMDIAAVTGSCLATLVLIGTMGSLGFVMYRRRYMNPPQTLNSDKCSNPDSSGYIDDSTIRDNSEEMYSLDNDSFLNSLEAMTIQNYWTDSVKHTKL